ncbi:AfsR/SARP family transcriptional regulator [Asanoa iriomotensis]|uniref:DNA-binding SARP family transcriptional activator n=1 Tax=Asanoa iriomotensis TaxID=234613 RepID=A0ABQ4C3S8_9ACTN|nr:BTAD domain-containing putative transcriptional regulator [Asanoa iriomotensis]GIF57453.1 hypothetical protein Air01nite_35480 [Asanoa iriomotensis]
MLGLLLLEPGQPVAVRRLADLLSGDRPPQNPRAVVQTTAARLRRALAPGGSAVRLIRLGEGYALRTDPNNVDAYRFRELLNRARAEPDPEGRARLSRQALGLWRGEPLGDVASDELRNRTAGFLVESHRQLIELRIAAELELGRHEELAVELSRLIELHPCDEQLTRHLMVAHYLGGRRQDALNAYRRHRNTMTQELGLDPGAELRELESAILRGDQLASLPTVVSPADLSEPSRPAEDVRQSRRTIRALPAVTADFVGREAETRSLCERVAGAPGVQVLAISGVPGVGKSAFALRVAHLLAPRFPRTQLYLDLLGDARPLSSMAALGRLLRMLGVPSADIPAEQGERAAMYRAEVADGGCLLVLDNASAAAQVRPLLPGSGAVVVVSSRRMLTNLDGAHQQRLSPLTAPEGVRLLAGIVGQHRVECSQDSARAVVERCGLLPLAIRLFGARLAERVHLTLAEASEQLAEADDRLDLLRHADRDVRTGLLSTLRTVDPTAQLLLRTMAALDVERFPAALLRTLSAAEGAAVDAAIAELVEANLVEPDGRDPFGEFSYRLHELVRLVALEPR